jgi:hypothetical protein
MFINKVREIGFHDAVNKALENKEEMIQYFLNNKWTTENMIGHKWVFD